MHFFYLYLPLPLCSFFIFFTMQFSHLHNHSEYSLLDGASSIDRMYKKAIECGQPAIALTDHGNMFGIFDFVNTAYKFKNDDGSLKVKPIIGCEFYLVEDRTIKSFTKGNKDKRYHQVLLAKNEEGYRNLTKLCSLGFTEGLYSKWPRIDKQLVLQYAKGLIATTCCLGARVPKLIIEKGEAEAEIEFKWWLDLFGADYYVELQRHGIPEQEIVNKVLISFANKYNVPIIASNDSHYIDNDDYNAHDILLCVNTNEKKHTPINKHAGDDDENFDKKTRFGFFNDQFYIKSTEEMTKLFSDLPQAIDNTNLVISTIDTLNLEKDILLPHFPIPDQFKSQDDYLHFLTYEGAKVKYKILTPQIEERLQFELSVIKNMGFAGYFLIVSDFILAAKKTGIYVGPGRGSAAGSAVAYCIDITNVDPIKYDLLFERFLNPDRKSMPDIDTDFEDTGRQAIIEYVKNKYGQSQVAHIVTYGTMAAKMSIKDVARVMDMTVADSNALAKLVPERPGISLANVLHSPLRNEDKSLEKKYGLQEVDLKKVEDLRNIYSGNLSTEKEVLLAAERLEGTVRNTGIHAAGIIIAPKDLSEILPVFTVKDKDTEKEVLVTQFEGSTIENAGVIKMDFLGLKNLTILKEAILLIKKNQNVTINLDELPLDDVKTYELYQRGATNGTFQFESPGMQKHLIDLKPDKFDDLIAMNALYRPGPIAYIPNYIARKHGREPIQYDFAEMEEYLSPTYGITVYQEQVMLLSQKLANFSKGDADVLRKAMGKKQIAVLTKMKSQFMDGCSANNLDTSIADKVWKDWEAFAQYAFNKSHSTCYALVAYHTAYLKAHYPSEYMAAVLNSQNNIEKISFYMEECKRMKLTVLGPHINESDKGFSVNHEGIIRFGLGAIKGVGEAAVEDILKAREQDGAFKNIFDFVARVNSRTVNKKSLENLVYGGAFDLFTDMHRAQYFEPAMDEPINNLEKIIKYGQATQSKQDELTNSLFGAISDEIKIDPPKISKAEPWGKKQLLDYEKEVLGLYISGHPLDDFKFEIDNFNFQTISLLKLEENREKLAKIAAYVIDAQTLFTKTGKAFLKTTVFDYTDTIEIALFGQDYVTYSNYFTAGQCLEINCGFYKNTWGDQESYSLKLKKISLLEQSRIKNIRELQVFISIANIDTNTIENIKSAIKAHIGNTKLIIVIHDSISDTEILKFRAKKGINPSAEFTEIFKHIPNVKYRLKTD
jgi:DNA polymerase III subunit alpha